MINTKINDLIRYAKAKGRNICYYYSLDIQDFETGRAERCQYMHILRDYRKSLVELIQKIPENSPDYKWISTVIGIIPDNVKKKYRKAEQKEISCNYVISKLSDFIYGPGKLKIRDNSSDTLMDTSDYRTRQKAY